MLRCLCCYSHKEKIFPAVDGTICHLLSHSAYHTHTSCPRDIHLPNGHHYIIVIVWRQVYKEKSVLTVSSPLGLMGSDNVDRMEIWCWQGRWCSTPCRLHQYWRTTRDMLIHNREEGREIHGRGPLPHHPTIPPSAEQEEKRLRPENRAPTDCKLALCAFAQGLTGDKNLDRRDPRVVFLFWWPEFN